MILLATKENLFPFFFLHEWFDTSFLSTQNSNILYFYLVFYTLQDGIYGIKL